MMIKIKNVNTIFGDKVDVEIGNGEDVEIDAFGLTMLPALIDPHVHFRVPGAEHKENWISASQAAIAGGVTTVIDMPNNTPACTTLENLTAKHEEIRQQIEESGMPLRYYLYFGADKKHLDEIPKIKGAAIGIKVFMGSSTGDLLIDDEEALRKVFHAAAQNDLLVSVHAEDEGIIRANKRNLIGNNNPSIHSIIRSREAAIKAVSKAIELAMEYGTRLCILHVSTKEEIDLIRRAKAVYHQIYAEAAPHHLFLNTEAYERWGTKVVVNPPLRDVSDQEALWKALNEGVIDFIGTDHAPHLLEEKALPYGEAPSGIPSIELLLPLLLDAVDKKQLTLSTLVKLTRRNIEKIFRLADNDDVVLVDLNAVKVVGDDELKTKCRWSPYKDRTLKGWPVCTIAAGKLCVSQRLIDAAKRDSSRHTAGL